MTRELATIARVQPAIVRIVKTDGSSEDVKVSTKSRKRWEPIGKKLSDVAWTQLDLLDAGGGQLATVRPLDQTVEETASGAQSHRFAITTERGELLQLLNDAQTSVLDRFERIATSALRTLQDALQGAYSRIGSADQQHLADMQTIRELYLASVDLEDEARRAQEEGIQDPQQMAMLFLGAKLGLVDPAMVQRMFGQQQAAAAAAATPAGKSNGGAAAPTPAAAGK